RDSANQRQTVILTLTLDGTQLRADVNSDRRADEVIALVASIVEDAELVEHDIRELDEAMVQARTEEAGPKPRNLLDDPEMADVRAEIVAELERRWLDGPVPALGNRTPLEAAQDPIGRHALERLLDSFDETPGLMSPQRLRQALGL